MVAHLEQDAMHLTAPLDEKSYNMRERRGEYAVGRDAVPVTSVAEERFEFRRRRSVVVGGRGGVRERGRFGGGGSLAKTLQEYKGAKEE